MKESSWCERRDLNPYGITTRPSNVRVCRFRHSRVAPVPHGTLFIIAKTSKDVKRFLKNLSTILFFLFGDLFADLLKYRGAAHGAFAAVLL